MHEDPQALPWMLAVFPCAGEPRSKPRRTNPKDLEAVTLAIRRLLVSLIVLSTVAFAVGAIVDHSSGELAAEGSGVQAPAHDEGGEAVEGSGEAGEGGGEVAPASKGSEEPHGEATLFGTDPESTPLVVLAIVASLLLAAGCWFRPEWRWLLVVTAFAMAAFAVLDLREVIHQLDESDTGLAFVAGAVATLHVAAAVTAVILARRSREREAPGAA
jgi:hypothetical protein